MELTEEMEDFTLHWFNNVFNAKGMQVHDFEFTGETGQGRGFMGTLKKVELKISKLDSVATDSALETLHVVLKTLPTDPFRKSYASNDGFASREISMYLDVFAKWEQFLDERKVPSINRFRHPICYYGAEKGQGDKYNFLLILENLTAPSSDFVLWSPGFNEPLPWPATAAVIQQIARFHAIGIAYKMEKKFDSYYVEFPKLSHTLGPMFKTMWEQGFNITEEAIRSVVDDSDIPIGFFERFNELRGDVCMNFVLKWFTDPTLATVFGSTICHHDLHSQNIVLSRNYDQAVLFDYQASCVSNPMKDLSFFLILNCESADIPSDRSRALELYHDEFEKMMTVMRVEYKYSMENIRSDYDRHFAFSLVHIITGAPIWINGTKSSVTSKRRFADVLMYAYNKNILHFPDIPSYLT
ncbi:hypothetical protein Bhyg_14840 [Pseudolycoriella hygida]|uniref:CHK kinase-like domain-containing protein n=1 Tax=Pseudolycoriella hygida TaxID=35572 RepID=A0A9Q0RXJ5_9DIPT|nr:hypothetical protein Bhyg_14840 [Pseudolycoriella hygida]